ncbi:hypothetical protein DFH08DRAFT_971556 [Mycena albidolilacea]|uniref:Uncharacterized protein n=1 Tax=Mycena albidolilacea TaxID=1033008 RepID=A0AAD7EFG2_9AGAR|nr:hypothetical protein DFH08DRAFT_971556 [Mycena albidolilacea]
MAQVTPADSFALFAAGPSTRISCHVVIKETGQNDISQVFAGVSFPSVFLVERGNTLCTTALALITGLQHHLAIRDIPVDPGMLVILNGSHPCAATIIVATTRVPDFHEESYMNIMNGYRPIGGLLGFGSMLPPAEFDGSLDVPAAISGTASSFFDVWSAMGIVPESHFILIFLIKSPTRFPSLLLPPDYDIPSFESNVFFSPVTNEGGLEPPVFNKSTSTSSSASASPSRSTRSTRSSSRQSRSPSPYPSPSRKDGPQHNSISEICRAEICDFENLQAKAKSITKGDRSTPLALLARRFYAMEKIILGLGLDPGCQKSSRSFTLSSGQQVELTVGEVLDSNCFKWSFSTFSKKQTKYKLAKSIALRTWKEEKSVDDNAEIYHIYLGIKFLWADNGPLALLGDLPSSEAQGEEGYAARLKEADLKKCSSIHDDYTR